MNLSNNNLSTPDLVPSLKYVSVMYLIWSFVSYGVLHAGVLWKGVKPNSSTVNSLMILGFVFLASFLSLVYIRYVEKHLKNNKPLILSWLLFTLLFFSGIYLFARFTGHMSSFLHCLTTANLIVFACIIGNRMTGPLKRPIDIILLCVVAALADLFSVFYGPTKYMTENISDYYQKGMEGAPPFVDFLLIKIPLVDAEALAPVFGVSDWIIVVFLSAAAYKFGLNDNIIGKGIDGKRETPKFLFFPIGAAGLCLAVVFARGANVPVPALPFVIFLYIFFMAMKYPEIFRFSKS